MNDDERIRLRLETEVEELRGLTLEYGWLAFAVGAMMLVFESVPGSILVLGAIQLLILFLMLRKTRKYGVRDYAKEEDVA